MGQILRTNRTWYKQVSGHGGVSWFRQYRTKGCRTCPAYSKCIKSKNCRLIRRSEYAEYYERNLRNTKEKKHLYRRRQAIVEHPYGTLKREWGFCYILTKKGIARAGSAVGFMFIAYNLRRIVNLLTPERLKEYLRILVSLFLAISSLTEAVLMHFGATGALSPESGRRRTVSVKIRPA